MSPTPSLYYIKSDQNLLKSMSMQFSHFPLEQHRTSLRFKFILRADTDTEEIINVIVISLYDLHRESRLPFCRIKYCSGLRNLFLMGSIGVAIMHHDCIIIDSCIVHELKFNLRFACLYVRRNHNRTITHA